MRQSDVLSSARAALIAQIEALRATTEGNLSAWRTFGMVRTLSVVVSADDECDETASGSPYAMDDPDLLQPPVHPNCYCSFVD